METTVARDGAKPRHKGGYKGGSGQHHVFDSELTKAKRENSMVDLTLAADFATPDDGLLSADDTLAASVLWVDRYSIKFRINGREVWISKAFIAGVWLR